MKTHIVLYRDDSLEPYEAPFAFVCESEGADHAEEQCENAYPGADIVWVHEGACIEDAYAEYWDSVNVTEATEDQLDIRAAGASTNGQPTDQTQAGNMVVVSDLPAEDIQHLVQAFRKGGMLIEQDVPAITNTPFRAQVRGQFVPFTVRDAAAIEQVIGEPLCVIPHVIPFAMPLSVAMTKIADLHWKSAVQDGRTTLGLQDWKRQYLLEHKVSRIIQLVEQQQG